MKTLTSLIIAAFTCSSIAMHADEEVHFVDGALAPTAAFSLPGP